MKTLRRKLVPIPGRRRISRKDREKWRSEWLGLTICSYPPEDVAVEGFGDYAKKRAIKILSEDQSRTVPFTTSLLDGINARETARNWVLDGKIYVNENRPFRGNVGSLVIVFDEDEDRKTNNILGSSPGLVNTTRIGHGFLRHANGLSPRGTRNLSMRLWWILVELSSKEGI